MFNKLFGKKNDGFYMQIDESAPPKAAEPKEAAAKEKITVAKANEAKADENKESAAKSEVAPAAVATIAAPADQKTKSAKTSIKKDKKEDKKPEKATEKNPVQPEAVAAAPVAPAFTNFATDYLVTSAVAGNRRRPGANMKGFMSMARDVKEMKKGSQGNQQKAKAAKRTEA
jgi:hypothetical protein